MTKVKKKLAHKESGDVVTLTQFSRSPIFPLESHNEVSAHRKQTASFTPSLQSLQCRKIYGLLRRSELKHFDGHRGKLLEKISRKRKSRQYYASAPRRFNFSHRVTNISITRFL